jgi:hypothetical protein
MTSTTGRDITFSMDQRTIVLSLRMKELLSEAIHHDLVATLGPEAVAYSIVTWYFRTPKCAGQNDGAR